MSDMRVVYNEEEIMEVTRILLEMRDNLEHNDPKYNAIQIALDGVGCLPYEKR